MQDVRHSRTTRIVAALTLASQVLIVLTGGLVRLTESGLGCTDWPHCTADAFFPVAEHGIHGYIEYANRVWGAVVVLISLWMFALTVKHRKRKGGRELVTLAALILVLTAAQAFIGAIVVWLHLRPDTVGIHFLLSAILVAMAAVLFWRIFRGPRGPRLATKPQTILTHVTSLVFAAVVLIGTLTTGAGPHAGDGGAARNGLDPVIMSHLHAWPSYGLLALAIALVVIAVRSGPTAHLWSGVGLVAACLLQMIVGIVQSNSGLPISLVAVHMLGSMLATAAMAFTVVSLRDSKVTSA